MAIAFNGTSAQIIRIPNCSALRGRETLTVGFWIKRGSGLSGTNSIWRHDGVLTPCQLQSSAYRMVWWNVNNNISSSTTDYAFTSGPWQFGALLFSRAGAFLYRYIPGASPVLTPTSLTVATRTANGTAGAAPMCIGGTETSTEFALSGVSLAELMVLRTVLSPNALMRLAHEPQSFASEMLFYAPLRNAVPRTVEVNGRSYGFQYGVSSRSLISENGHPPVEKWRTGRSVLMGVPLYQSATLSLRARVL